jgi:Cold shock proteins
MAETYSKKERNKKKLQKRKEKEQRRDEKRFETSKSGRSLEDMIAYVDENGNLSSTPPDERKVSRIALEDIAISTPKEEAADPTALPTGTISYYDASKGYGFITNSRNQERIFVHRTQLADPSIVLATGDKVEYQASRGPRGMQAELVRKV